MLLALSGPSKRLWLIYVYAIRTHCSPLSSDSWCKMVRIERSRIDLQTDCVLIVSDPGKLREGGEDGHGKRKRKKRLKVSRKSCVRVMGIGERI